MNPLFHKAPRAPLYVSASKLHQEAQISLERLDSEGFSASRADQQNPAMKNFPPVSEKPQVRISLPLVKPRISERAGIFCKTAFCDKRQNSGLGTAGGMQPLGFCFRGHTRDLQWVCTAILFAVSGAILRIHSIFQMSASRFLAGYVLVPRFGVGPGADTFLSGV